MNPAVALQGWRLGRPVSERGRVVTVYQTEEADAAAAADHKLIPGQR